MSQPVLLRLSSLSVAVVSLLQATLPGVAVGLAVLLPCALRVGRTDLRSWPSPACRRC
ncbi:MAG: hypothetical protein R3E65_06035 [Steroidobacteraceae bacterium]